ncbi:MAG: hypothetical protein V5A24_04565 [Haloarculaceae archaeon]
MSGRVARVVLHSGHVSHGIDPAIPAAVFLVGLLFLAAGVYLLRREDVEPVYANAGLGLGSLGVLGSIALAVV